MLVHHVEPSTAVAVFNTLHQQSPTTPHLLRPYPPGHSLGGLIAALACLRDQSAWSGLLLCSAALDVEMGLVLRWAPGGLDLWHGVY